MGLVNRVFYHVGKFSATHPGIILTSFVALTIIGSLGLINLKLENDPQALWVSPTSRGNKEQNYFKEKYGAFFRITQTIMKRKGSNERDDSIDLFQKPYLEILYNIQTTIENERLMYGDRSFNVSDICYKPITGKGCMVTSPLEFWLVNLTDMWADTNFKETARCIRPRYKDHNTCFDRIGTPIMYPVIFGNSNYDPNSEVCNVPPISASALSLTYLLNNNKYTNPLAEKWEKDVFMNYLTQVNDIFDGDNVKSLSASDTTLQKSIKQVYEQHKNLLPIEVNFMTERSIPDNLEVQNSQNAGVVVVSYTMMFIYISVSIGFVPSLLHSRFILGLSGIIIVISCLGIALGLCSYMGVGMTMISTEVVPFLILAIGVDNMFIITRSERTVNKEITDVVERIAKGLSNVGPSIFTAATCEFLAFLVGVMTDIPALQSFCMVAAIAVFFDFLFQVTVFIALLALDNKRINSLRYDLLPCLKAKEYTPPRRELVRRFFENYLTPFIQKKWVHIGAAALTLFFVIFGILASLLLGLGIAQKASVSTDSDIHKYFEAQDNLVDAGPPAYLVFRDLNYTDSDTRGNITELLDILSAQSKSIQKPIYSWFKAFKMFTMESGDWIKVCGTQGINAFPFNEQMRKFVKIGISSECCLQYGLCGEQYVKDIVFDDDGEIETTRFRFQHPPLRVQADYIRDLQATRYVVDAFNGKFKYTAKGEAKYKGKELDERRQVFAYSLFYVYFEQYYYIRGILTQNIMLALGAVFLATQFITSIIPAAIIAVHVFLICFSLIGFSYFLNLIIGGAGVEYNAVFVVNIVMSCGLAVEFCVHLMIAFMRSKGTRTERVKSAMNNIGSSILVGIGSTKFIGVLVLAFAPSTIFRIYYFRMYMSIILLGLFYGLIVLPIILLYAGPKYKEGMGETFESEEEVQMIKGEE